MQWSHAQQKKIIETKQEYVISKSTGLSESKVPKFVKPEQTCPKISESVKIDRVVALEPSAELYEKSKCKLAYGPMRHTNVTGVRFSGRKVEKKLVCARIHLDGDWLLTHVL
jgi:hypothetical protein